MIYERRSKCKLKHSAGNKSALGADKDQQMKTQSMGLAVIAGASSGIGAVEQWQTYEAARQALLPNLSRAEPAARYATVRYVRRGVYV